MTLPFSHHLPVNKLAASFNNTSATYKFYWFLSILQWVEMGNKSILKNEIFARMISNAWYTVNYFKVSFGKQDLIQQATNQLLSIENITIDEKINILVDKLIKSENEETKKILWHFDKQVPHWFLSPWFSGYNKKEIYIASNTYTNNCLYSIYEDKIEINPNWFEYLQNNAKILKDFCYWNLTLFLQQKNPNVPDIPNKLIKPAQRNSLTTQRHKFWNVVMNELGSIDCIYTGNKLTSDKYAVEHFIPFSFVSHDLIWNLIPADNSFNSTKSNKLPRLEDYFDSFYKLQYQAIEIIKYKDPKSKFLEEYLTIFPSLDSKEVTKQKFKNHIQPLITIASNNGFEYMNKL